MWCEKNHRLTRDFAFNSFAEALAFINRVGEMAERQNHHPTIINTYNRVRLELTTHDAGNTVTEKDWALARAIDDFSAASS
jgi:4a-hydroxytetrahydrobiopterin dehydratase